MFYLISFIHLVVILFIYKGLHPVFIYILLRPNIFGIRVEHV